MMGATYTADNLKVTDNTATAAFAQTSRLLVVLCASALLHAAVIGLWPDAAGTASATTPTARVAVRLQHEVAVQQSAPAMPSPAAMASVPQAAREPVASETKPKRTRTHSTESVTTNSDTAATQSNNTMHPSKATNTSAQTNTNADIRKRIHSQLQHALSAHFDYPPLARRRGWEGVVQVSVRIETNGQLSQLRLVASSGFALLDRAALKSISGIQRLSDATVGLNGQPVDMILPIRYQLTDS